ncbi:XRE family transcriptional regulator [Sphingomonas sp. PAMC26645]|nr:XRE family transcriptional regulator [Sphingomonas sp. PAMC26645]
MRIAGEDQSSLARAIGITQGAISKILQGKTANSRHLPRIAHYLGSSLPWLLGETNDPGLDQPAPTAPAVHFVTMQVALPSERALTRMFEGLLRSMDLSAPVDVQAQLLAKRLPIGLSQLRDLLPDTAPSVPQSVERPPALATTAPGPRP